MVYIVNREQVSEEPLLIRDAKSTKVRYLIDQRHGANNFYLRLYEIEPGGRTPHDQHPYEHEVYVLRGRAKLLTMVNDVPTLRDVEEGDVVFIAPNQVHQFSNPNEETFQILCVRGAEGRLRRGGTEKVAAEDACSC